MIEANQGAAVLKLRSLLTLGSAVVIAVSGGRREGVRGA